MQQVLLGRPKSLLKLGQWHRLSQELELKQHALALLKERAAGSESAQLADSVAVLEAELAGEVEAAWKAKEAKESMVATAKVSYTRRSTCC